MPGPTFSQPYLEIRLFGGLHMMMDGEPVRGFISAKAPALLAYLACEGRACMRDELAALLWGEMPEADAKNNLRQALSNLRRLMGHHLLITRRDAALNNAASWFLDVAAFEAILPRAAEPEAWEQAVALYRGDFMAGVFVRDAPRFEEWMLARRARYQELALYAWHNLTEHYLRRGDYGRAIDSASRLLELDPWREEAHRQLMRALTYCGQRAAALRQYENCRRSLAEGLGVSPSGETTLLYERIRAAGERPRHNLPTPPTPFIGREKELARIEAWLAAENGRLLTIIGLGGAGKTRLALQAARAHTSDFLEGVWFVPLASEPAGSRLEPIVSVTVGCPLSRRGRPRDQLLDYLSVREMLLVLDNVEHLLSRSNLTFLADLIARAPGVQLLVTSRQRLHLRGETTLELGGLSYDGASQSPAERLFVEYARRVRPGFDPAGQEEALARLCRLTDGLPLALELAAAWTRALDAAGIVAEIERGLDFLAVDWPDLPPRQRSLQAVFDYSWQRLTPPEQEAYASLSVFRGGFTADAARAVAGVSLPVLAGLIDKSLLRLDDDGRYRRHPLLLQFAEARLAAKPDAQRAARRAHARFYGDFMQRLEPMLFGGQVETALARMRPELENVRLAWKTAATWGDAGLINAMADAFMWGFDLLGLYQEGLALAREAIASLEPFSTTPEGALAWGRAHLLAAVFAYRLHKNDQAATYAQAAMRLLAPLQPHVAYGHSLLVVGAVAFREDDVDEAMALWRQAADVYRMVGFLWGECAVQANLAEAALTRDDLDAARRDARAAHVLARRMENSALAATALLILTETARREGDFDQAWVWGREAVALHRQVGDRTGEVNALTALARVAADQGDDGQAAALLTECAHILRQLGREAALKRVLKRLAQIEEKLTS